MSENIYTLGANLFFFFNLFRHATQHVVSQVPNPHPLKWKHRILTTRPPGKSLNLF